MEELYPLSENRGAPQIQRMWNGLADGATVLTPLAPAPFAPLYGMLTDRFGVTWIVDVTPPQS